MKLSCFFILLFAGTLAVAAQEAKPTLTLRHAYGSSAPSGAVLHFSVEAAPGVFQRVFLIGEGIDGTPSSTSAPYEFSIWAPRDITGPHRFRAVGISSSGQMLFSRAVVLNLSPLEEPLSISTPITFLHLFFVGDTADLRVTGHYGDGHAATLTRAPGTAFRSSDSAVVSVDANGVATAAGPGIADIEITHGGAAAIRVQVTVPKAIPGDLNGDGKVDEDDLHILQEALGSTPGIAADARDLNHDGAIDAADRDALARLCTKPGCVR